VNGNDSITLLQPGSTPGSQMTAVATINLTYPQPWDHDTIGIAARPTPGVANSYDLVINVGSQADATATPPSLQVALSGTGFSSVPSASLNGDSLYLLRIDESGSQPAITSVQQVATGIRNVYGMQFDANGNLYFADNGIDYPSSADGAPPQADELDFLAASDISGGIVPNYGFPDCYTQFAYGSQPGVPVGSGCVQPLAAFQPITDSTGTHPLVGPTSLAFAPANFPEGFNDGVFVGFTGGGHPIDQTGLAYYDFATGRYSYVVEGTTGSIIGVGATNDALYFEADGNLYQLTSAAPEPSSMALLAGAMVSMAAIVAIRRRWSSSAEPASR
jgi:glucose/arabinose dehydrogenase